MYSLIVKLLILALYCVAAFGIVVVFGMYGTPIFFAATFVLFLLYHWLWYSGDTDVFI